MNERILPLVIASVLAAACGGQPSGSSESSATSASETSAHGRKPTPASAWPADEPVPPGTPELSDEPGPTPEEEDRTPEDVASGSPDSSVGTSSSALSTSTGTTFKLTYYWIAQRPASDRNQVTLRDCDGKFLTYASYGWRDKVRMEMTGRFTKSDGTKVTFNDWGGCWKVLDSAYGWGAGVESPFTGIPYRLRLFRSIAVDPSVLRIGRWYYVKQLDGVRMPYPNSTMVHDGCVRAVDESWSFSGKQIDFYTGLQSAYSKLDSTLGGRTSVTVYDGSAKCATHIARGY